MKSLLDTNAYSALRLGNIVVGQQVQRSQEVLISVIVAGELIFGFLKGSRYEQNASALQAFLAEDHVSLMPVTWSAAEHFGRIFHALRKQGTPIPTNDIWLAAQAMEAGATLVSADRHFARVQGLSWFDFTLVEAGG